MPGVYFFSLKNDGRVSNLCQPSDPFSDLYIFNLFSRGSKSWSTLRPLFRSIFFLFSGCWNRYNLWWRGAAHFFARSLKWLLEPIFRERLVFFLFVLTIIPIVALLKTKKHDSSTNIRPCSFKLMRLRSAQRGWAHGFPVAKANPQPEPEGSPIKKYLKNIFFYPI